MVNGKSIVKLQSHCKWYTMSAEMNLQEPGRAANKFGIYSDPLEIILKQTFLLCSLPNEIYIIRCAKGDPPLCALHLAVSVLNTILFFCFIFAFVDT